MSVDVIIRELKSEYLFTLTRIVEKPLERKPTGERRIFRNFLSPIFLCEWLPRTFLGN